MLDQLLEIKLYMYEADGNGKTCLYQCFDESVPIENCAKVFETMIKKHGFDITRTCYEAQGRTGRSLLKGVFWKLFEVGDDSEESQIKFWQKVECLLTNVGKGKLKQAVVDQTSNEVNTELTKNSGVWHHKNIDLETCECEKCNQLKYYTESTERLMKLLQEIVVQ